MVFEKEAGSSSYALPLPAEVTPLLPGHPDAGRPLSSQPKTFANVFIAIVGAGVLGLPYAFSRTGWAAGSLILLLVSALTFHCMMLLVRTRRRVALDPFAAPSKLFSFGDLALAVSGASGRLAVDAMIVLSQAGFCVSYLVFISNTLVHLLAGGHSGYADAHGLGGLLQSKALYVWGMFPFQLGLNSIKTLTHLAPLSIFADVVDVGAMGVVMGEDVVRFLRSRPPLQAFGGLSVVPYGVGIAVYAFEGIGLVLPLESETADKSKFGRTLGISMAFIYAMYALFGVLGYAAFGPETRDIITTNLGRGLVADLVQLGLCLNLFVSFPLMMNPVYEALERALAGNRFCLWLRWGMVLAISLVALFVPNFADFLSLVGSSACCLLGFVLPAWFHLRVFRDEMGLPGIALDVGIIVLGLLFAVSGTWSSLAEIFSVKS